MSAAESVKNGSSLWEGMKVEMMLQLAENEFHWDCRDFMTLHG